MGDPAWVNGSCEQIMDVTRQLQLGQSFCWGAGIIRDGIS